MTQQQTLQPSAHDLVHTKLVPPQLRPQRVARAGLLERLDAGLSSKLTLVSAPAGFGKTTLVADWLAEKEGKRQKVKETADDKKLLPFTFSLLPFRMAWVALDAGDNDPLRFWRYLLAACQTFDRDIGVATLNLLRASVQPDYEAALTLLLNDLELLPGKSVLVLEDYHVITTSQIHEQLAFLLEHLPAALHLVLLTRSDPPLPLARLRAHNHLNELRAEDMQLSLAETQTFLRQALAYSLPDDAIAHLRERTEGWVAGLHLIALSLGRHHDIDRAIHMLATLSGRHRHITAYFGTEVLQTQAEPIQMFLLQTSALSRLTAPLCDAVTGRDDSAAVLEHLERANLFIVPLDEAGQWYRYHALFAESVQHVARQRLGEAAIQACSARASAWYEQQGLLAEAVEAALEARAFARAALLLETMIGPQHFQEHVEYHTLRRWLGTLPQAVLAQHPKLCLRLAMITLFSVDGHSPASRAQIERSLTMAERRWLVEGYRDGVGAARAARAIMAGEHGEPLLAARLARDALGWIGPDDHNWRAGCLRLIGSAQILAGAVDDARKTLQSARTHFEAARNSYGMRATLLALGNACLLAGELRHAAELYRAVSTSEGVELVDKGNALLGLAQLSYEWNDLVAAEHDAQSAYQVGLRLANQALQVGAAVVQARIQHARGQTAQAQQLLYKLIAQIQTPLLLRTLQAAQIQLALATGDISVVERWRAAAAQHHEAIPLAQQEREALLLARLYIAQGNQAAARELLADWRAKAHADGRVSSELEIQVLTAISYKAEHLLGQQTLRAALSLAHLEGFIRLFLDQGDSLADLLRAIEANHGEDALGVYARSLLSAAECESVGEAAAPASAPPTEHVSPQELRVLQLLAAGHSNQQIAESLVVSVNTVKTQLKSIYRKLNVTNRVEACMAAQRLELL